MCILGAGISPFDIDAGDNSGGNVEWKIRVGDNRVEIPPIKRDSRNNEITANDRPFGVNSPPSAETARATRSNARTHATRVHTHVCRRRTSLARGDDENSFKAELALARSLARTRSHSHRERNTVRRQVTHACRRPGCVGAVLHACTRSEARDTL